MRYTVSLFTDAALKLELAVKFLICEFILQEWHTEFIIYTYKFTFIKIESDVSDPAGIDWEISVDNGHVGVSLWDLRLESWTCLQW